ncbi:glycoside hydrolase family 79 protein [Guyanagaster necrorhizus]|uniref:Glycoside hydrolase family 79 protein n=1 Tax=Guyanagaster necrorhizus TaxID=856835 RepID=A0A9P7W1L7_9AGAR|nr:glycoside hydrolase family 79 protein [Guyanagaster necrorhizus MCA 3950]KAG7450715.1 glycoside hydrolase family 79 protein [Guyanagaster necrorhizus MCA 3950]
MGLSALSLSLVLVFQFLHAYAAVNVSWSTITSDSSKNVVQSNFLGVSFELSFMDQYFGNDTSTIPQTMLNYLSQIRNRTGSNPVRLRIGGNSADSSTYLQNQTSPMLKLTDPDANSNNQPVDYGPMLWDVLQSVSGSVEGVEYLIGVSLSDPNNTDGSKIGGDAKSILGNNLDSILVGNEPDLYTSHGNRPLLQNYTVQDYIGEFSEVSDYLNNTSAGDLLNNQICSGPTICCDWDLATLLQQGYLATFSNILKYITLQHYPQNNCFGSYQYGLPYYLQHSNTVALAGWQQHGIDIVVSNTSAGHPRLVMSEFNSASCGGIANISDTFAVGSLWTLDYALQMAAIGYSAVYIHTREKGVFYNLIDPPNRTLSGDTWTTNPPFYAVLVLPEILQSDNGSIVVDLNLEGSMTSNSTVAGYAVYDAGSLSASRLVLFNYDNSSVEFSLENSASGQPSIKYLASSDITEKRNIAWGEESFVGTSDGKAVNVTRDTDGFSWLPSSGNFDCSGNCAVEVPGPSLAVVYLSDSVSSSNSTKSNSARRTVVPASFAIFGLVFTFGFFYLGT